MAGSGIIEDEMSADLTAVFYTSNFMTGHFIEKVKEHTLKVIGDCPLISVSQKPMDFGENICIGDVGRSHLNIYRQILIGAKAAKTKYIALVEDDILYHPSHFTEKRPSPGHFLYDMNKWSIFTWTEPPMFSLRRRKVVNHVISERSLMIEAMEERFARFDCLEFGTDDRVPKLGYWGDPGRYEQFLGVKVRPTQEFYASAPGIVFSHPEAYGYTSRGERKALANEKSEWLPDWGTAAEVMGEYYHG